MTSEERQQLITQYRAGADEVVRALDAFPRDQLTAHPIEGKWSAAEIIHHLSDSETTSGLRFRRLLAEDHPLIQGYDQDVYAARLNYNQREIGPALDLFRSTRPARRSCSTLCRMKIGAAPAHILRAALIQLTIG